MSRILLSKNPKLFDIYFENPLFSKTFQVQDDGVFNFHNYPKLSKTHMESVRTIVVIGMTKVKSYSNCLLNLVFSEFQSVAKCRACYKNCAMQHVATNRNCCTEMLRHPKILCEPCRSNRPLLQSVADCRRNKTLPISTTLCKTMRLNGKS